LFLALYIAAYAVLNSAGLLLVRSALKDRPSALTLGALAEPRLILGLGLYALGFLAWIMTLRRYELATVYPVFVGVGYVSVVVASALLLSEQITVTRLMGILLVGVGVILVVR
jgi:multidrug transporter EmrE-like cation transporter